MSIGILGLMISRYHYQNAFLHLLDARQGQLSTQCWHLRHLDTFAGESYFETPGPGEGATCYPSEAAAQLAALARLEDLEKTQPTASSGGQGLLGIQDRVFIMRPDGTEYRFTGASLEQQTRWTTQLRGLLAEALLQEGPSSPERPRLLRALAKLRRMAQGITDAMQGRDRAAENRARLLRDLRGDPAGPAFDRAVRHLVRSIVDRVEHGPVAEYAAIQDALQNHLKKVSAHGLAALATFGLMAALAAVEGDQADAAAKSSAAPTTAGSTP